ncbi:MAG: hypothetical protein ACKO96_22185, partial [Flammeovirgaceae bacterium]
MSDTSDCEVPADAPRKILKGRRQLRKEVFDEWVPKWTKIFGDDSASLLTAPFPLYGLTLDCVSAVDTLLVKDPPIKIYGKDGIQHRNVGFFSLDPAVKHYNYSKGNKMPAMPT